MIAIYVHTHWAYNHPYAARTWTLSDWEGFLSATRALGYDTVMIWPQCDTMPVPLTPSDVAFLEKIRRVIDMAHGQFQMEVLITSTANTFCNEKAAGYTFEDRSFWDVCRNIDPADSAAVEDMLAQRKVVWEPLARADGIVVIDSDPGGYPGSPSSDFVKFFRLEGEVFRALNPGATIYYWMWCGWPHDEGLAMFEEILALMKKEISWPWKVFTTTDVHLEATDRAGIGNLRVFNPYNVLEAEPSFPLTNTNAPWYRRELGRFDSDLYPEGVIFNAQTHCLQIPRIYLSAHHALGGTYATEKLSLLAERLVPGIPAGLIAFAWQYLEEEGENPSIRYYARRLREEAEKPQRAGDLAGLMMMPPGQYLCDLADNLDLRADLVEWRIAVESGRDRKKILRKFLSHLRPYQDRLGYNHICWGGPLRKKVIDFLEVLEEPRINAAAFPEPGATSPKGYLVNLLDVLEEYAENE